MSLRDRLVETPASPAVEWRSADNSTRVAIPPEIVDQLAGSAVEAYNSVAGCGMETGGILLGEVRLGAVTNMAVTSFEPIPCEHRMGPSFVLSDADEQQFRMELGQCQPTDVLGYYRSHTRNEPGLDKSDRELVERLFPGRSGIVLLIKPSGESLSGEFYFFQGGRLDPAPAGRAFRFQGTAPGGIRQAESSVALAVQEPVEFAAETAAPVDAPAAVTRSTPKSPEKNLHWEIFAAGVMIAAALGLLYWQYHGDSGDETAVPAATSGHARVSSLGLTVQTGEGGWRVTWDPNSPAARNATGGALNVIEDNSHERIPLNASEIRSGSATYRPIGDDITFRLEMATGDTVATETYRVFMKEAAIPMRVPVPRPQATPAKPADTPKPVEASPKTAEAPKPADAPKPTETPKPEVPDVATEVIHRVSPEIGEGIRPRISAPTPVDVRVHINRDGHVTTAAAIQHGDGLVDYLAARAVAAARQWTFTPAQHGGKPIESTRVIHFVFEQ